MLDLTVPWEDQLEYSKLRKERCGPSCQLSEAEVEGVGDRGERLCRPVSTLSHTAVGDMKTPNEYNYQKIL